MRTTPRPGRARLRGRSCACSCKAVDEDIRPEQAAALFDREAAGAAHVEVEADVPGHADAAVNLDAVARGAVIGFGGGQARRGGSGDEIGLALARGGMDAVARKSGVYGKSVSVRVNHGCRRTIKKNTTHIIPQN